MIKKIEKQLKKKTLSIAKMLKPSVIKKHYIFSGVVK